jgi:phosphoribosyl 1,2-cyclic phosphodiesterase
VKLTFHGTRGEIEARTSLHGRHTVTEIAYQGARILFDAGRDWLGELDALCPDAIVVTHAHPDHAAGLRAGAPCPVWATAATASVLAKWPLDVHAVEARRPFRVGRVVLEAFEVEHSVLAPAVGYRVSAGRVVLFYVPDVLEIVEREAALRGCLVYVGDGATLRRPLVRKRGGTRIGHAPVSAQLAWCEEAGVPRAIFTHCGSEIVTGDPAGVEARLQALAREHGVHVKLAYDGLVVLLR